MLLCRGAAYLILKMLTVALIRNCTFHVEFDSIEEKNLEF